jgi:hypothetical protein
MTSLVQSEGDEMPGRRTEQVRAGRRNTHEEEATAPHPFRPRPRTRAAEFVAHGGAGLKGEIKSDPRYFSVPLWGLGLNGAPRSLHIHKGIAICLVASAILWAGGLLAIRAL